MIAEWERLERAWHDALPQVQGDRGDGGEAGREMCQFLYEHSEELRAALATPPVDSAKPGEVDLLDRFEKFDGIGPHAETIRSRASIGERYLEAYESASSDPRLVGYAPADCPSELLLDLLNTWAPASLPEPQLGADGDGVERLPADGYDGQTYVQFVNELGNTIRVGVLRSEPSATLPGSLGILVEGPSSRSENWITEMEARAVQRELSAALTVTSKEGV